MSVDPNWARWVFASLATLLKGVAEDCNLPVIVEGLDERTTAFMEATDRVEIRITGPFTRDLSRNYYELSVDANAVLSAAMRAARTSTPFSKPSAHSRPPLTLPSLSTSSATRKATTARSLSASWSHEARRRGASAALWTGRLTDRIKQTLVDARYLSYVTNHTGDGNI